jgi:hypothetical protein
MRSLLAALVLACSFLRAADPPTVPMHGVHEIAVVCSENFANPFRDARCRAIFIAPSGTEIPVDGFYDGGETWRVRFVPREQGAWRWRASIAGAAQPVSTEGTFRCDGIEGHGFLRIANRNRFRYEYEDGTPFLPIGIQTCNFLRPDFDGPALGEGPSRHVSNEEWLREFAGAVNLVRTQIGQGTTAGCALPLIAAPPRPAAGEPPAPAPAIDRYDLALAARIDEVYRQQRRAGMSQILILFQDMSLWGDARSAFGRHRDLQGYKSLHAANLPQQEQYIRYLVARYGAFVDIWEIFNEDSFAPDDYLAHLAAVVREADPYDHLLTTNYSRPGASWCDITTWHEYMGMPANEVDLHTVGQIAALKSLGKLVQNTEFGNQRQLSNHDPVKWRIAVWASHMHESSLLFWSMSQSKMPPAHLSQGNANAYIGPDSRRHFRVFHQLTAGLPIDLRPRSIGYTDHADIRAYALGDGRQGLVYIHHFSDHTKAFTNPEPLLMQSGPGSWRIRWHDPEDGREVRVDEAKTAQQYLAIRVPELRIDLVARIERID